MVSPVPLRALWALLALLLAGAFWRLHPVWVAVPEYEYGLWVPLLAAVLLARRLIDLPPLALPASTRPRMAALVAPTLVALLALVAGAGAAGVRPFLEVSPLWPFALWVHTASLLLLVSAVLARAGGARWALHFAPALLLVAAAAPWPGTVVQATTAQLRPAIAWLTTEALNLLGYPALWEGTTITLPTTTVGVDEACSGLRSLQATFTLALFLGEFFRFRPGRRVALVLSGFLIAALTNFLRAFFLSWQAARLGHEGVDAWHDSAGYTVMTACFAALGLLAWSWQRRHGHEPVAPAPTPPTPAAGHRLRTALTIGAAGVGLLVVTEAGTRYWFARGERLRAEAPAWTYRFPVDATGYRVTPLPAASLDLLRSDQAAAAEWREPDGTPRAAYFFRWERGQGGRWIPQMHTPDVCLPLSGAALLDRWAPPPIQAGPHRLAFTALRFSGGPTRFLVFYCLWQRSDDLPGSPAGAASPDWWSLHWNEVRAGRRGHESQSLMLVFPDAEDREAEHLLRLELAARLGLAVK